MQRKGLDILKRGLTADGGGCRTARAGPAAVGPSGGLQQEEHLRLKAEQENHTAGVGTVRGGN